MTTPAGWYPDTEVPGGQRYWDGNAWTENRAPGISTAPPATGHAAPTAASAVATKKPVFKRWYTWVGIAVVVIIIGSALAPKGSTPAATGASPSSTPQATESTHSDPSSSPTVEPTAPSEPGSSFVNGVLTTPDVKIVITSHKVIPVGKKGNEYGSKPVIAYWYKITRLGDKDVTPMDWLFLCEAYQDNNPNAENKLSVGMLPDSKFGASQLAKLKKGGTVENAVAYELSDLKTPVVLVAGSSFGGDEIGRATYALK